MDYCIGNNFNNQLETEHRNDFAEFLLLPRALPELAQTVSLQTRPDERTAANMYATDEIDYNFWM